MVDVRNRDELTAWLETQPRAVAVTVAVRAALRVLPLIHRFNPTPDWPPHRIETDIQAPVLRAIAATRLARIVPSRVADDAANAAYDAATDANVAAVAAAANVAAYAADAAAAHAAHAYAAHAYAAAAAAYAAAYAAYAAYADAAAAAANAAAAAALGHDVSSIRELNLIESVDPKADLRAIRPILNRRLWSGLVSQPPFAEDWRQLAAEWGRRPASGTPSNSNWWVWTEWYQAILDGTLDDARARLYVRVPDRLWKQGIEAVNAHIAAKLREKDRPKPKRNLPSAYRFPVGPDGRLFAVKTNDAPTLPFPTSAADHLEQLEAAHALCARLLAYLRSPTANVVRATAYQATLEEYAADLPRNIEGGSILLAETTIQILRGLFQFDEGMLPEEFKERFRVLLLNHQGLRVYYPSIARNYENIRSGHLTAPLPLDAIKAVEQLVKENTPTLFDPSVGHALAPMPVVTPVEDAPPPVSSIETRLPPDPVAEVNPAKARTYGLAAVWNALYKGLHEGEKLHKAVDGWSKAYGKMAEIIQSVSDLWPFK